jgi:hypothetical protein
LVIRPASRPHDPCRVLQLFKTPWEPATPGRHYTAIISTDGRHKRGRRSAAETVARQIIRFRHGRRDRVRSREYAVHSTLSTFARIDGAFQDSGRARADFFDTVDGDHRGLTVGVAASPIPEVRYRNRRRSGCSAWAAWYPARWLGGRGWPNQRRDWLRDILPSLCRRPALALRFSQYGDCDPASASSTQLHGASGPSSRLSHRRRDEKTFGASRRYLVSQQLWVLTAFC